MMFEAATTRGEAALALRGALSVAAGDAAGLEARLLLQAALGIDAAALLAHPGAPLGPEGARRLDLMAGRRLAREPVSRILGTREFWGLPFVVSRDTLVPRPETETVVEAALAARPDPRSAFRVLDLGTGSGCLLLAILFERPAAWGLGIDRSEGALQAARANARALGLGRRSAFAAADWGAALGGRFDVVVSNPPYIRSSDMAGLEPEVAGHDPRAALDGGPDGLGPYRAILPALPALLTEAGLAVLEFGIGQAGDIREIARGQPLEVRGVARDLAGRARAISLGRTA